MYRDLIKAYMEDQSKESELDDEVASLNKQDTKTSEPKSPRTMLKDFDKTPVDYHYWSKKK